VVTRGYAELFRAIQSPRAEPEGFEDEEDLPTSSVKLVGAFP